MNFLRLYLGEITGLALVLMMLFVAAKVAARYFSDKRKVQIVRNICFAVAIGAFAASWVASIAVNQTPRGRISRADVDQDQKQFEQRYSDQTKPGGRQ